MDKKPYVPLVERPQCGQRNGTYCCQREEGHTGNRAKHVAITVSANKPMRFVWGDGKEFWTRIVP